jgi:hypothetical protein
LRSFQAQAWIPSPAGWSQFKTAADQLDNYGRSEGTDWRGRAWRIIQAGRTFERRFRFLFPEALQTAAGG